MATPTQGFKRANGLLLRSPSAVAPSWAGREDSQGGGEKEGENEEYFGWARVALSSSEYVEARRRGRRVAPRASRGTRARLLGADLIAGGGLRDRLLVNIVAGQGLQTVEARLRLVAVEGLPCVAIGLVGRAVYPELVSAIGRVDTCARAFAGRFA